MYGKLYKKIYRRLGILLSVKLKFINNLNPSLLLKPAFNTIRQNKNSHSADILCVSTITYIIFCDTLYMRFYLFSSFSNALDFYY